MWAKFWQLVDQHVDEVRTVSDLWQLLQDQSRLPGGRQVNGRDEVKFIDLPQ